MGAVKRLFVEESGQGLAEYGLILGLVAIAAIAALVLLGDQLKAVFDKITGTDGFGKIDGVPNE